MEWLMLAASRSKIAMAEGKEPACMLDEWVKQLADPAYKGRKEFSDHEMAMVIFSFLFASQDAMSSGLIYGFQHLADMPEVLSKVREEQERVRGGDYEKPMTLEMYDQMVYLKAFVKESMRVKPPVTMVRSYCLSSVPLTRALLTRRRIGPLQNRQSLPHLPLLHHPRQQHGHPLDLSLPARPHRLPRARAAPARTLAGREQQREPEPEELFGVWERTA